MSRRRERSGPEWATFAGCCVVVLVLIGLIGFQLRGPQAPPAPVATISAPPRQDGGRYRVDVVVTNQGNMTAADVQVVAALVIGDDEATGDQSIQFLAGGEEQDLVFYFRDDPAQGELTVDVTGFANP